MPASNAGISLPEVARMIEALRNDTTDRFDKLDRKFDSLDATYVRRETYVSDRKGADVYIAGMETRVAKLENTLQWVLRTAGGAFMVAVIGAFFAASKWI
jgi:DNA polymerase II small subunit/DNA polymerase delta subunit B